MPIFKRLLGYSFKYKYRLIIGLILSLFVSIFNGVSLTSMIPIFDSMGGNKNYKFQISISKKDILSLERFKSGAKLSRIEEVEYYIANLKFRLNEHFEKLEPSDIVILFISIAFPLYFLKLASLAGATYYINSTGYFAIRDLRDEIYNQVLKFPIDFFVREKTGIVMSRIINDVDILAKIISADLKDAINDFFYIITHLTLLFLLNWQMVLVVFFIVPVIMGPITSFSEKIRKATKNQQERLSDLNGLLQEVIAGIRVIRAFSMEKRESGRFFSINKELADKTFKGHFYHQVGPSLVELFGSIVAAIFLAVGAYLISSQDISRGTFIAFFMTLIFLMRPIKQLSVMYNMMQSSVSAGERVFELIDYEISIQSPKNPKEIDKVKNSVEFRNVSYSYPGSDKLALKNLNFKVKKGETVAFVGHSGAGKSTLKDLLPRLIDPKEGGVYFDDVNIKELDLFKLRKKIAIVSQDVFLFHGTIKENVAYGNLNTTDEQIIKACNDAFAMEFISGLKEGIDTVVGENGYLLSGGQKQRISIARALLADPEILILDEATSALDTESERALQETLETIYKKRTTFIIAHRLSTIQIADRIFYMEEGEIIEEGTHSELIEKNGKYKQLYEMQFELKN